MFDIGPQGIIVPLLVFAGTIILGFFVIKFIFRRLYRLISQSSRPYLQIFVDSAKFPAFLWLLLLAAYLALVFSHPSPSIVSLSGKILLSLVILSVTSVIANTVVAVIKTQAQRANTTTQVTSLMQNLAGVLIYVLGILLILYNLDIQITPILATLGIGGLAVALALQSTLADLVSGFYISASRQIRIGDFVKLESGEEGYVTDISWRATQIQMIPKNIILVPNEKLAKLIVTNYHLNTKELLVQLEIGVHYNSDLERVEKVTLDVAREILREYSSGKEWEPYMRYHTFSDFSVNFTVFINAREVLDGIRIKHEFIKRLHKRYKDEGIVIPFPIAAINYEQEHINNGEAKSEDVSKYKTVLKT